MTASNEENAKKIGELEEWVERLDSAAYTRDRQLQKVKSALDASQGEIGELQARVTFLMGALSAAQESTIRLQALEMTRMQERIDAGVTP